MYDLADPEYSARRVDMAGASFDSPHARRVHRPREACRANWNGDTDMNAKLLLPLIAATLLPLSAHALDCSGGANGGMDATGNQCNDAATVASSDGATLASARLPKVETSSAASYSKRTVKHTAAARHTSARVRTKHG